MNAEGATPMSRIALRRAFWRAAKASRATVIIDADDYFRAARSAMLKAKRVIVLVGWDFDARIPFAGDGLDEGPQTLGAFISWLVKRSPLLEIR